MRSLFLPLVLIVALGSIPAQANGNEPVPGTVPDTTAQLQHDSLAGHRAPWEADPVAPPPAPVKQEKSNASLFGWLFVGLAAAGITAFLWRSDRNS